MRERFCRNEKVLPNGGSLGEKLLLLAFGRLRTCGKVRVPRGKREVFELLDCAEIEVRQRGGLTEAAFGSFPRRGELTEAPSPAFVGAGLRKPLSLVSSGRLTEAASASASGSRRWARCVIAVESRLT